MKKETKEEKKEGSLVDIIQALEKLGFKVLAIERDYESITSCIRIKIK